MKEVFYQPLEPDELGRQFCQAPGCYKTIKYMAKKHRQTYYFCRAHLEAWAGKNKIQIAILEKPLAVVIEDAWEKSSAKLLREIPQIMRDLKRACEKKKYFEQALLCISQNGHYPDCSNKDSKYSETVCECASSIAEQACDGVLEFTTPPDAGTK